MKLHRRNKSKDAGERGYLLVGLLATMTISLIVMASAMPQLQFESQREREEEMLWRGQQIANALLLFQSTSPQRFPNTLEELVEGATAPGGKKIHFLRPHALCDPMAPCTAGKSNWQLVRRGDPAISSMIATLNAYRDKKYKPQDREFVLLTNMANTLMAHAPQVLLPGQGTGFGGGGLNLQPGGGLAPPTQQTSPEAGSQNANNDSPSAGIHSEQGPIVGVVSRSTGRPIRNILDIENYNKDLFFAGATVMAGGVFMPIGLGQGVRAQGSDPCPIRDPQTGICYGQIFDGQKPPSTRP